MKHSTIMQLLQILDKNLFIKKQKVKNYQMAEVGYFDWKKQITGEATNLSSGFGAEDTHYQLTFNIDKAIWQEINSRQTPCLMVSTADKDMWNTNNPQFIVTLNGELIRALDMNHNFFVMPPDLDFYFFQMNVYTNTVKPDVFVESWVCLKNEPIYQLYYRLKALAESLEVGNENDPSYWEIYRFLDKVMAEFDLIDTKLDNLLDSAETVLSMSEEWLAEQDEKSENTPIQHIVGHTHIDISWLWTLEQTREKVVRSFSNAVYLMDKNPQMTFMSSTPLLYEIIAEESPELFEKIKEFIAHGRWEIEGGMYVESDLNLPNGESLIRQLLYGKDYIRKLSGKESEILWLPDCFGFSAALPQIMKKSGITAFFTSKMDWNEVNKIPNDTFYWRGIDGSQVLTQFLTTSDYSKDNIKGTTYNGRLNASQVKGTWSRYRNKSLTNETLQLYGFGDGGGGPTDEMLEYGKTFDRKVPGMPRVINSQPSKFFKRLQQSVANKAVPSWQGELYLETHRGVFTTDGRLKKSNREAETALSTSEFLLAYLYYFTGKVSTDALKIVRKSWRSILINHFHDILPGTSIQSVHREAMARYAFVQQNCGAVSAEVIESFKEPSTQMNLKGNLTDNQQLLINSSPFDNYFIYESDENTERLIKVPAWGHRIVSSSSEIATPVTECPFSISEDQQHLETPYYSVRINSRGELEELLDIESQQLYFDSIPGNRMNLFPDRPEEFDAWNIDVSSLSLGIAVESSCNIERITKSHQRVILTIHRKINDSMMKQNIIFYSHTKRIDFETEIDWQESGKLLKVSFPIPITVGQATYGIQFGALTRPSHQNTSWEQAQFEYCGHRFADYSEGGFGAAVLCSDKYGYHIEPGMISLSLLRSPDYPAEGIDQGQHMFTYSFYPHQHDFKGSKVYQEAYNLAFPVKEYRSEGKFTLPMESSLAQFDQDNIIIETIKPSEDGLGLIVRCFEAVGQSTKAKLNCQGNQLTMVELDMMEFPIESKNTSMQVFEFAPFEIKTIKIIL